MFSFNVLNAECEGIAKEIFDLLDMNKDKVLNDEDLRSAELGTNGDAMTKLADAILERYQVRERTGAEVSIDQSRINLSTCFLTCKCCEFEISTIHDNPAHDIIQDFAELIFDMRVDLAVQRGNVTGVASGVTEEDMAEVVQVITRLERNEMKEEAEWREKRKQQPHKEAAGKDEPQQRDEL